MARIGLIGRCDQGGLANQTFEIFRHLKPERTLVVKLGARSRGKETPERFTDLIDAGDHGEIKFVDGDQISTPALMGMCENLDYLVTVETLYNRNGFAAIAKLGCQGVLIANPELFDHNNRDLDSAELYVPTLWEWDRLPTKTEHLRHPLARDVLPYRQRTEAKVFYHPAAPAMLDRNGTNVVLAAAKHVRQECKLIIRSHESAPTRLPIDGPCQVEWIRGHTDNYFDSYPDEADVIVMPRRYGGLCLPVQEAASLGMPAIMPDLMPQRNWPFVEYADCAPMHVKKMKGGVFPVHRPSAASLAAAMDSLILAPDRVERLSIAANEWSNMMSWESQLPNWKSVLA